MAKFILNNFKEFCINYKYKIAILDSIENFDLV